jgi:hypothetical protein
MAAKPNIVLVTNFFDELRRRVLTQGKLTWLPDCL